MIPALPRRASSNAIRVRPLVGLANGDSIRSEPKPGSRTDRSRQADARRRMDDLRGQQRRLEAQMRDLAPRVAAIEAEEHGWSGARRN